MSDRSGNPQPAPEDDDLSYLDGGTTADRASDEAPTTALGQPPPVTPRTVVYTRTAARDRSWMWPIINLVGLLVVIAINYLANLLEFNGQGTGDVVNKDPVSFQPAGWVFFIWGVIYLLLLAFTIYGLLPGGRRNVRLQRISPFFLIANLANVTWIVLWHWEQFFASLVTILVLLASLLCIYVGLRIRNPIKRSVPVEKPGRIVRLLVWVPFSVYLGWICVASLANLMVWLDRSGWDGGPFSYNMWAVLFMLLGSAIAAAFVFTTRDVLIPLVFAVAFAGICQHAWGDSVLVNISAIVFAVICLGLAVVAWVIAYDRDANRGILGRQSTSDTPPPMTHVDDPPREHA